MRVRWKVLIRGENLFLVVRLHSAECRLGSALHRRVAEEFMGQRDQGFRMEGL
jgi:hypothetical protein